MLKRFVCSMLWASTLWAHPITTLTFKGDLDPILGPFSKDNLLKACAITLPPFYKFWEPRPVFALPALEECSQTLTHYAHSQGFYRAHVALHVNEEVATFTLQKNDPILVASLEIDQALRPLVALEEGKPFSPVAFSDAKRIVRTHYANLGYPKAELDAKAYVNLDTYKVDVHFRINPRDMHTFGPVTLSNDARVDEALILREIRFTQGMRYDASLLEKSYEGLYDFGVYRYIALEQDLDRPDGTVPVHVVLLQGNHREIQYGFGYDTDTGGRLKALYKNDNFYGNLKKFSLGGTLNERGISLYNSLHLPRLFFHEALLEGVTLTNDITFENIDYESYRQRKLDEKITLSKELWGLTHSIGVLSEISRITSKLGQHSSGSYWINAPFYQLELDRRDDPLNPKNGYYFSFLVENGTKFLASEEAYVKTLTQFRAMKSIGDWKVSWKTKVGTLDQDLPIFKRFFAGGDFSNRGYQYQKVGPKDPEGNPYGGLSLVDNTFEIEYAALPTLGIVGFWDATMLRQKPNDFANDFYHSLGAGLRYYTPIGPLRIDLGFPTKGGGASFHLGIGQVF